jgi:hypothetical protein
VHFSQNQYCTRSIGSKEEEEKKHTQLQIRHNLYINDVRNEFLNDLCLANQYLMAFVPHNRLFRLRVLTNVAIEYSNKEMYLLCNQSYQCTL